MTGTIRITVETERSHQAIEVTGLVEPHVPPGDAAFVVRVPHTTCSLFLSEVDDELLRDVERVGASLLERFEPFTHARNGVPNAAAHIVSSMFGTSILLTAAEGRIELGRYQRIVLLELDGPKTRTIEVRPLGS